MKQGTGNQHASRKASMLARLRNARECLTRGTEYRLAGQSGPYRAALNSARYWLDTFRNAMDATPASTRRRWKCGR